MKGQKYDSEKPRWSLIPFKQLTEVVKVLTAGAEKYDDYNWQDVDNGKDRYFSAAMRHFAAWKEGERIDPETERTGQKMGKIDPETGLSHLAHAICNLLFLMWFDDKKPLCNIKLELDATNIQKALYKTSIIKGKSLWKKLGEPWDRLKEGALMESIWRDGRRYEMIFKCVNNGYIICANRSKIMLKHANLADETYANLNNWLLPKQGEKP